ncbi:eIF4E-associated protein Eap1 [Schizosaccharomyces pombe]|uniref:Uncharacterized protein C14G10.04 n=1 Tax=Schizosaccharomyces pombe (strain 972 / ATCC 24843) TaxID=284812 RepID=YJL4_SCHPO|nr:uncharacterized protein SPCC14G10.04 [Schizosaccharomyces pombe]O74417.1 RecName: Full=Uncharacterized protein C14G10.04 [Schizosaccharomyces pombe 972h-]CAA20657.1 sequence orphan [Schizosaccharomyces pombe]|eukprot:NP_587945.1 uncharacterized protein SPCC14G10.04 [Schizosaccharomyces pombe]
MSQVIQYSEADLLYLSKSPLIKKPENLPEWILPEAMKADRERHIRQEKEMKRHDDDGRQYQSDRKFAKSKHDDIILGPPKLSFASSNENGRSVGRHDDLLSLGNVYNGVASLRYRNGASVSRSSSIGHSGSTAPWSSVGRHNRKKDNEHRDEMEGLEKVMKQRAGNTGPLVANSTEEFEAWKRMMKASSGEAGAGNVITPGVTSTTGAPSGKASLSRAASNSSTSARAGISVDSLFGKRSAAQAMATVVPSVSTPGGTPPRFASPALTVESMVHAAPSTTTSSRFSKFFNGLAGPETSKTSTPNMSNNPSPRVANTVVSPAPIPTIGSATIDKDAEGFQRVLAMLGRQASSTTGSPKVALSQMPQVNVNPSNQDLASVKQPSGFSPPSAVAPPPGLGNHNFSNDDSSFFRSLMTSDTRSVPPPPGFSTNAPKAVKSPEISAPPGLYRGLSSGASIPSAPPGFGYQQPSFPYSPGFPPSAYNQNRTGYGFPDTSRPPH